MKFSNSLKFNAVSEWWEEYINYSALKKKIYELAQQYDTPAQHHANGGGHDSERAGLLGGHHAAGAGACNAAFIPLLDTELKKISNFYAHQEKEVQDELDQTQAQVDQQEERGLMPAYRDDTDDDDDDDDDEVDESAKGESTKGSPRRRRKASVASAIDSGHGVIERERSAMSGHSRRLSTDSYDYDIEASVPSMRRSVNLPDGEMGPSRTASSPRTTLKPLSDMFRFASLRGGSDDQPETVWNAKTDQARDTRILFKRRLTSLYISATSLRSYVELNQTGFRKVLKKYDKVTQNEASREILASQHLLTPEFIQLKDTYLHDHVEKAEPFTTESKDKLNRMIASIIGLYAKCVTRGDMSAATKQLRIHQREQIVWERDTVWRQMIGRERRGESDGHIKSLSGGADEKAQPLMSVPTPVGRFRITSKGVSLIVAIVTFVVLLNVNAIDGEEANRCFAILCFSTVLWATEAIPLFVTSMMVPLLVVILRVVRKAATEDETAIRMSTKEATGYIFSIMFSPTIMLLIGGFTIASALSKTSIDRILITRVLSLAGTRPSIVLLAFMGVSCFASMWISNVAAPTLCFTLLKPVLRNLPPGTRFAPCVILGIALAANIGGQSSPISSPQNLIAIGEMDPELDWLAWFAVSLPVSGISILLIWLLLLASYKPNKTLDGEDLVIKPIRATREGFTAKQYFVSFVCVATIGLWCFEHGLEKYVGDMGIIAIIPVLAFFGTGVLKKADFDQFLWTVVFLAMGGIALGKAVTTSGLLQKMDSVIRHLVSGLSPYAVVWVLALVVMVVSTFISHTIAAVLLVPIAKEVGTHLPESPARLLIFITGLVASCGMALPVSGFPNQTAASQEDDVGNLYLSTGDFIKNGIPASVISTMVVVTIGYALMKVTHV